MSKGVIPEDSENNDQSDPTFTQEEFLNMGIPLEKPDQINETKSTRKGVSLDMAEGEKQLFSW